MNKIVNKIFCGTSPLKKVKWVDSQLENHSKTFEDFTIRHNILGDLKISLRNMNTFYNPRDIIELKNKDEDLIGKEIISFDSYDKAMYGYNISVISKYCKKGLRLGEILRTFSVLALLKNEAPHLGIYSLDHAVYFHSKYKFKPSNLSLATRDKTLDFIANENQQEFSTLSMRAKAMLKNINSGLLAASEERILCHDTNELTECYINKALKEKEPEKRHPFSCGIEMILTRENVLKNKEFFNNLFEKYGVDYKI